MDKEIIFMDGEFAKLKPDGIDLISIALIKESGEELYLEIDFKGEIDPWVKEKVVPFLNKEKVSKKHAIKEIRKFVGKNKPIMISHVYMFDWLGICNLFDADNVPKINKKIPFHFIPVDFSSMLFTLGIPTGTPLKAVAKKYKIPTNDINTHNALDDTRLLKRIYENLF